MENLALNLETIEHVKVEAARMAKKLIGADLIEVILYGSCARGDYTEDSDIDIALLMKCDRMAAKKYDDVIAEISTELAMKYFAVVNFVSLPYSEFVEKRMWYGFYGNIDKEGEVAYAGKGYFENERFSGCSKNRL